MPTDPARRQRSHSPAHPASSSSSTVQPNTQNTAMPKLTPGCRLPVKHAAAGDGRGGGAWQWRDGEILASRPRQSSTDSATGTGTGGATTTSELEFYIHYTNFNKRLDEWVSADRLDLTQVRAPESSTAGAAAGAEGTGGTGGEKKKSVGRPSTKSQVQQATAAAAAVDGEDAGAMDTAEDGAAPTTEKKKKKSSIRSKEEEIEALRHGGSMTHRPEEVHRVKNIHSIVFGEHQVETWYFSPYPAEYTLNDTVYICEFCLSYYNSRVRFNRHREKCTLYHPPGNEIYRKDDISFFEIDGHRQRTYCRNLCLLSKLFLDHKTLYYDVNPFLFYVMTHNDHLGCHIVGYFSKEKESLDNYNVACILTLPNHQRKGYGKLLIAFSYELSKCEGKLGSPEKPLSDLGLLSYRSYWADVLLELLFSMPDSEISIDEISAITSMTPDDVLHTMQALDLIRYLNGQYVIVLQDRHREQYDKLVGKRDRVKIDPACLQWKPPQFTATQLRYI